MPLSTITVQSVVNFAATHTELMPLAGVGGYTNEPALSLANDTLQELLSAPFAWKFNRAVMPTLVTQFGVQDYLFGGASAWTVNGGACIDLASNNAVSESGNTVTVNCTGRHSFSVGDTVFMTGNTLAAYNSTFTQTQSSSQWTGGWAITAVPSATSFQFTHQSSGLGVSGSAGITDCSRLQSGTFVQMTDTSSPQFIRYLVAVRTLQPQSRVGNFPDRVALVQDLGTGIIQIRFSSVPGNMPFGVTLIYQKKAPVLTALTATWAPFPDEFSFAYRQAFLARCYRFVESRRADLEEQKALQMIAKAQAMDDTEESEDFIAPESPVMGWWGWGGGGMWW